MKKLIVLIAGAMLVFGCGLIPDEAAIKKLIEEDLEVVVEPGDHSVSININGVPAELPRGLDGLSVFVTKEGNDKSDPVEKGVTEDKTVTETGLNNGEKYIVAVNGEVGGQVTGYGFSRGFYPRPGGYGDYLGYDPGTHGPTNAVYFDRLSGAPTAKQDDDPDVDFYFYREGEDLYFAKRPGVTTGGVTASTQTEWLDVQDAPISYASSAKLVKGGIYQFQTEDNYFGKIIVDSVASVTTTSKAAGDAVKVWLRYAFQTAQGVGHY